MRDFVRRRGALAVALGLGLALAAPAADASTELVKNGLLAEGRDGTPDHWRSESYSPAATAFGWATGVGGVGVLRITSTRASDARWVQSVPVSPDSWYQISGWVRAEDVGTEVIGAHLSVLDTFFNSRDLRGSTGWESVAIWVKTGPRDTVLSVACRLGGYSALNTGTASCTGISVVPVGRPLAGDPFVFGGAASSTGRSHGVFASVAVLVVVGLLLLAWRFLAPRPSELRRSDAPQ